MSTIINGTSNAITFPDGTIQNSAYIPAGSVVQVVNATYSTITSVASNSFADTGLTASITPKFATSKILVIVDMAGCTKNATNTYLQLRLLRNSTTLYQFEDISGYTATTTYNGFGSVSTNYLDSPATTSATIYKVQLANGSNTGLVAINNYIGATSTSSITLMEIAQ